MKNYSGNREPFIFVFNTGESELSARVIDSMSAKRKIYVSGKFSAKTKRIIRKAAAVVLMITKENLATAEPLASYIVKINKDFIPIYPEDLTLPAGMDMLISTKQALFMSAYPSLDELVKELDSAPALSDLSVTNLQKKASLTTIISGVALSLLIVGIAVFLVIRGNKGGRMIDPESALGQMGLTGDYSQIKEVYIYGEELRDAPEAGGAQELDLSVSDGKRGIHLSGSDEFLERGYINSAEDFTGFINIEELTISGNALEDISPLFELKKLKRLELSCNLGKLDLTGISALSELEYLDLGYSTINSGLDEIAGLTNLKTLIIASEYAIKIDGLSDSVYVVCPQMKVSSWDELKAASEDPHVFELCLTGTTFTIPEGETLVVKRKVSLTSNNVETVENYGTIELYGIWEMGMVRKNNRGTVRIGEGGVYSCGMGDSYNYGAFIIEKGGTHELGRGEQFYQESGEYVVEGELVIGNGGQFYYRDGEIRNNGLIRSELSFEELNENQFAGKLTEAAETGRVESIEDPSGTDESVIELTQEEIDQFAELPNDPSDEASLDENGLTPRESAYFNNLNYCWPRMGGGNPRPEPVTAYTDPEMLMAKHPERNTAYIARDMVIEHCPAWADGYFEFMIAPGATVTLKGDDWTADSAITVMKGGTLIVEGTVNVQLGVNFGTVISRGRFTYTVGLDKWGNEWGIFANDGQLKTEGDGVIDLYHIWTFPDGIEEGSITATMRFDYTHLDPPFKFANGYHSFGSFKLCYRAPDDNFDKKWWLDDINLADYENYSNDPTDKESLDEHGMTPRERAIYEFALSLDFLDYKTVYERLTPVVNVSELDLIKPRDGDIYIARDMEIERASKFWYENGGIWNIAVAPGATVTIKGDQGSWTRNIAGYSADPNDIWITVMQGGTLIIDGELPFGLIVNHGDLIVTGKLFSTYYSEDSADLVSMIANDGTITVNPGGSLDALQLWSFKGAKEVGDITLHAEENEKRYDFTNMKCPFAFEHGAHGFNAFYKYNLDPEQYADNKDQFAKKFWD